jgi:uncharacterized protein (DUF58 family)
MLRHLLVFLCILGVVALIFRFSERRAPVRPAHRRSGVRITREGWLFGLFTLGVLASALHTGVNLVYLTFSVLASAFLLSCALTAIACAKAGAERSIPEEVVVGERFRVRLSLRNASSWLPVYCLSVDSELPDGLWSEFRRHLVLHLRARHDVAFDFPAVARRRGLYDLSHYSFGTSFPFGFFEGKGEPERPAGPMLALPQLGTLKAPWYQRTTGGGTAVKRTLQPSHLEDFYGIREYRPGDNPSWIHWKMTARHQKAMVREFGSYQQEKVLLALCPTVSFEAGQPESENLEKAVSFLATLAQELCRSNTQTAFVAFSDRLSCLPPSSGTAHFHKIWRELALVQPPQDEDYERFLRFPHLAFEDFDRVVLARPGRECPACSALCEEVRKAGGILECFEADSEEFDRIFGVPPVRTDLAAVSGLVGSTP